MANQPRENLELLMEQTWVKIQQRTFTRWCNTFLVERMMKIEDLMGDFHDGIQFCNLLEIISGKKLPKWNTKPRIKAQKLENVSFGLHFLKKEGIKLVAIGPEDVVEPKLKLILGLIWTIILRYQIQRGEDSGGSARSELLKWVRSKIPEYDIKNFQNDWKSGKAICALAEAVEPGQMNLPGDFTGDPLKDCSMGMNNAEKNMEIPMVLYPEDMTGDADELSNMTYISYFRDYEERRGQRDLDDKVRRTPVAEQCRAYGPGLEGGEVLIPADFVVEARNAKGEIIPMGGFPFTATCTDPAGRNVPVDLKDNSDGTLSASYLPQTDGKHIVEVKLSGQDIGGVGSKKSPFPVLIKPAEADHMKTKIFGPGVERAQVGSVAQFTVQAFNRFGTQLTQGGTPFHLTVTGPAKGADPKRSQLTDNKDGTYTGEYLPVLHGTHVVLVELHNKPVAQCPINVPCDKDPNAADASKSWAEHLNEPTTIEPVKMRIHAVKPDGSPCTKGGDNFDVEVIDPNGDLCPATIKDNGDGTYDVDIEAEEAGPHKVDLFLRNKEVPTHIEHIKDFPKTIIVDPGVDAKATTVTGPGIQDGVLQDHETYFDICARDKNGKEVGPKGAGMPFNVQIKGPRGNVPCKVQDNKDGTYHCTYTPTEHGDTRVDITLNNENVAQAPYDVFVKPNVSAERTVCDGPGLKDGNKDTVPTYFTIETRDKDGKPVGKHGAGQPFKVDIKGPKGPVASSVKDNEDGTYRVDYTANDHGDHTIEVTLDDKQVDRSPYHVKVDPLINASKTLIYGDGVEDKKNRDGEPTSFTIETRDKDGNPVKEKGAGLPFKVDIQGPNGDVPHKIRDNRDGTYQVDYTPLDHGDHKIDVTLDDEHVADAPYHIKVMPTTNTKGTVVQGPGLEDGIIETFETYFDIECRDNNGKPIGAVAAGQPFEVDISGPNGRVNNDLKDNGDGTYHCTYLPEDAGNYTVQVRLNNQHVAASPYRVRVDPRTSTKETKCYGPGLEKESVIELLPTYFTIETRDKTGRLMGKLGSNQPFDVKVKGPTGDVPCKLTDNGDGTYKAEYTPKHSGPTTIEVTLGDEGHVADSPYNIDVQPKVDVSKTICHGPGLEDGILDTQPTHFMIETRDQDGKPLAEKGANQPFVVDIQGPDGKVPTKIKDNKDGTYRVDYEPTSAGNHHIEVTLEKEHVADSPYDIRVDEGAYARNTLIERYSFVVRTKTRKNTNKATGGESDNFKVWIEGPGSPEHDFVDNGEGSYTVSYSLPNRGRYTINVQINGEHIQGSPFTTTN